MGDPILKADVLLSAVGGGLSVGAPLTLWDMVFHAQSSHAYYPLPTEPLWALTLGAFPPVFAVPWIPAFLAFAALAVLGAAMLSVAESMRKYAHLQQAASGHALMGYALIVLAAAAFYVDATTPLPLPWYVVGDLAVALSWVGAAVALLG